MVLGNIYSRKNYWLLMLIPVVLLVASLGFLFTVGLKKGVDLQGGLLITVQTDSQVDLSLLESKLTSFGPGVAVSHFNSAGFNGIQIEMGLNERLVQLQAQNTLVQGLYSNYTALQSLNPIDARNMETRFRTEAATFYSILGKSLPQDVSVEQLAESVRTETQSESTRIRQGIQQVVFELTGSKDLSFNEVGSSLSKFFFTRSTTALIVSFILSGITILIIIRGLVASAAVISGAIFDVVITAGLMSLLGIELSLGSIVGLLMLLGLSLDTDVMLTINVLKRKEGAPSNRAFSSLKTGLLMNLTALAAFSVLALIGYYYQVPTYTQIGLVVAIGVIVDFIATWCFNASIILWYAEKKGINV